MPIVGIGSCDDSLACSSGKASEPRLRRSVLVGEDVAESPRRNLSADSGGFLRMEIKNEQQYQDAMTELKLLERAPAGDNSVQDRRRELEAAAAKYTEQLKSAGLRKGRPDPH
jgi:hypothetical protein